MRDRGVSTMHGPRRGVLCARSVLSAPRLAAAIIPTRKSGTGVALTPSLAAKGWADRPAKGVGYAATPSASSTGTYSNPVASATGP